MKADDMFQAVQSLVEHGGKALPKHQSSLTGAAGECYVMYRLLRMGYIAALAPKGVPNSDIIVTDVDGELAAAVQVKTKSQHNANRGWHMKAKQEAVSSPNLYYCFVDDTVVPPVVFVMPSAVVADTIREAHSIWLNTAGRGGHIRKDNDIRWLLPDYSKTLPSENEFTKAHGQGWLEQYRENWTLLNLEKNKCFDI